MTITINLNRERTGGWRATTKKAWGLEADTVRRLREREKRVRERENERAG